jgi:AAA family ATP:ADP antiporter
LLPADLGWIAAASATPAIMLAAGAGFFGLSLAANQGISVLGMDPTAMALAGVAAGAVTQVFARSAKFSLFDPAKEMVYIEMSREEKSKGKAAVDLLGSQIGKSGECASRPPHGAPAGGAQQPSGHIY